MLIYFCSYVCYYLYGKAHDRVITYLFRQLSQKLIMYHPEWHDNNTPKSKIVHILNFVLYDNYF